MIFYANKHPNISHLRSVFLLQLKDMSAIISLVSSLDEELKKGPSPSQNDSKMFAILTSLSHVCRCLRLVRKFLRFQILPPLREVITRPEESNTLKGRLVKLLTNSDISLKVCLSPIRLVC